MMNDPDCINRFNKEALSKLKSRKKLLEPLKKKKGKAVDQLFFESHKQAFSKIDCLDCANCCKTVGPLFNAKDITRISKHFKLSQGDFTEKYLKIDEDNDYVLKSLPCPFLGEDNYCGIYDIRPKGCKDYPLTDLKNQKKLFKLHLENSKHCPAVNEVFNHVSDQVNNKIG